DEIKIMTLRNAISKYPDCLFIDFNKISLIEPLTDKEYFKNKNILYPVDKFSEKYHPKTLIYIIEYKSQKQNKLKYTVLIPKKFQLGLFDFVKYGFNAYFE